MATYEYQGRLYEETADGQMLDIGPAPGASLPPAPLPDEAAPGRLPMDPRLRETISSFPSGVQGDYSAPSDLSAGDEFRDYGDPGLKTAARGVKGFTHLDLGMDPPDGALEHILGGAMEMGGMASAISGPTMGLANAMKAAAWQAPKIAASAATFAGYEALNPDVQPGDVIRGGSMGAALPAASGIKAIAALTKSPLGRFLYDSTLVGAMAKLGGAPWDEAGYAALGGGIGFGMTHGSGAIDPRLAPGKVRPLVAPEMGVRRPAIPKENVRRILSSEMDKDLPFAKEPLPGPRPNAEPVGPESSRQVAGQESPLAPDAVRPDQAAQVAPGETRVAQSGDVARDGRASFLSEIKTLIGAASERVEGVASTRAAEGVLRGEMTRSQYAAALTKDSPNMTGNIESNRAQAREMLRDKMGKNPSDKQIDKLAEELSIPEEVRVAVKAGEVVDLKFRETVDPRRFIEGVGGRQPNSPIQRHVQKQNERFEAVADKIADQSRGEIEVIKDTFGIKTGSQADEQFGRVAKITPSGATPEQVMAKPEFTEWVNEVKPENPRAIAEAAVEFRRMTDEMNAVEGEVHTATAPRSPRVPYQENYWPSVEAPLARGDVRGRAKALFSDPSRAAVPRDNYLDAYRNPRHKAKLGGVENEDMSLSRVGAILAENHGRTMGFTPAVANNEAIARFLRSKGLEKSAEAIEGITKSKYQNIRVKNTFAAAAQGAETSSTTGRVLGKMSRTLKSRFNAANYNWNPYFNMVTQWTSTALAGGRHPKSASKALFDMFRPEVRKTYGKLYDESYSGAKKQRDSGSMRREGSGDVLDVQGIGDGSRLRGAGRAVGRLGGRFTAAVERESGIASYAIATRYGLSKGWTPRQIADYASDLNAKSQSMYDPINRAEGLKNPFANALIPAQSFAIEVLNTGREFMGSKYGIAPEGGRKQGIASFLAITGFFAAWEAFKKDMGLSPRYDIEEFANSIASGDMPTFKETQNAASAVTSLLPYAGTVLGTDIGGGQMLPAQVFEELYKGVKAGSEGDIREAYARLARYFAAGGAQQYKMLMTEQMVDEGRIPDNWERYLGWGVGPYSTPSVREEFDPEHRVRILGGGEVWDDRSYDIDD